MKTIEYIHQKNDRIIAYNYLMPIPVEINTEIYSKLINNEDNFNLKDRNVLKKAYLLEENSKIISTLQNTLLKRSNFYSSLCIELTDDCNMNCSYCNVPQNSRKQYISMDFIFESLMIWSTSLKNDKVNPQEELWVILYGGEPTLNYNTLISIIPKIRPYLESLGIENEINLYLSTNGTVMDNNLIEVLKTNNVIVGLGYDPSVQDRFRIGNSGANEINMISIIQKLLEYDLKISASTTLTPEIILGEANIVEKIKNLGFNSMGFNLIKGDLSLDEQYFINAGNFIYENSINTDKEFERYFKTKNQSYRQQKWLPDECPCYGTQLVARANNKLALCPFSKKEDGFEIQNNKQITLDILKNQAHELLIQNHPIFQTNDKKNNALMGGFCHSGFGSQNINKNTNLTSKTLLRRIIENETKN